MLRNIFPKVLTGISDRLLPSKPSLETLERLLNISAFKTDTLLLFKSKYNKFRRSLNNSVGIVLSWLLCNRSSARLDNPKKVERSNDFTLLLFKLKIKNSS